MKVERWISWEECEGREEALGGLGGWFYGQGWNVYLNGVPEANRKALEALRSDIVERGLRFAGSVHQNHDHGVPLFDDGSVAMYSWRAWGDLMAAIWSEEDGKEYSYLNFYVEGWNEP